MATQHNPTSDTADDVITTIRNLMTWFNISPAMLSDYYYSERGTGIGTGTGTSFLFDEVAPLVGLDPGKALRDIPTFELRRSRIPTNTLKSIIMDMDSMLMQYGPLPEHSTEEATSRFFSPIINHLLMLFPWMFRNKPESIIHGNAGIKGQIGCFYQFGVIGILFIEMKPDVRNEVHRFKAIAQLIAEANRFGTMDQDRSFTPPIHCILSDGLSFEIFRYQATPVPTFLRGCFHGDPFHLQRGLYLPELTGLENPLPFILSLRVICETIFDVTLNAYIEGLVAYYKQSETRSQRGRVQKPSLDGWEKAYQCAEHAKSTFRLADDQRKAGDITEADATVEQGILLLQDSTESLEKLYQWPLIMEGWDDDEVGKA